MFPLTAAEIRVLNSDAPSGARLLTLTTPFGGTRRVSMSQYPIASGANTWASDLGLQFIQTAPNTGIGTQAWRLVSSDLSSHLSWFRSTGTFQLRYKRARVTLLLSLFDPTTNAYLTPRTIFTGRGNDGSYDDREMVIDFVDIFGYQPAERRWIMSKEDQRRRDSADGALDNLNKPPPEESAKIG